jgi:hypothetical protein
MLKTYRKGIVVLIALFFCMPVFAAARSYQYDDIDVYIIPHTDSTVSIQEDQVFDYIGEYNEGYRSISHKDISGISNIEVIDGETGQALTWSPRKLDKTAVSSWGKYTAYEQNGATIIEWYYDMKDTKHLWTIRYVVHGGIGFYKDHDEIYWNLFTDYDVPVKLASAKVTPPQGNYSKDLLSGVLYRNSPNGKELALILPDNTVSFVAENILPHEAVTVAVGWPKGLILKRSFWKDWFVFNQGYFVPVYIVMLFGLFTFLYWYFIEGRKRNTGPIVAEYEPPSGLSPAATELILKESLSKKTWPATIVDLATRGYVKIREEEQSFAKKLIPKMIGVLLLVFILVFAGMQSRGGSEELFSFAVIVIVFATAGIAIIRKSTTDYILTSIKDFTDDPKLSLYEVQFLGILFSSGTPGEFSTKKMSQSPYARKELYKKMKALEKKFYKQIAEEQGTLYDSSIKKQAIRAYFKPHVIILITIVAAVLLIANGGELSAMILPYFYFVAIVIVAYFVVNFFLFNPRLSSEGIELRRRIKGFKMYLFVAERYRIQNLTPDLFEKYLSYAIVFGVEKQWAKNFESLNLKAPVWYSGNGGIYVHSRGSVGSGFSPVSFSRSFSTSFSSAFASTGGGGSSGGGVGGGGGAGGGGGGGGGGAS